jgi:hypothetical protein
LNINQDPDERECTANDPNLKEVCDEYYRGPYFGFWQDGGWVQNCSRATSRTKIKDLITILIIYNPKHFDEDVEQFANRFSEELNLSYPGMMGIIATSIQLPSMASSLNFKGVQLINFPLSYSENEMWLSLIHMAKTRYVLVGRSLHTFYGKWANIERSIRLFGSKWVFSLQWQNIVVHFTRIFAINY